MFFSQPSMHAGYLYDAVYTYAIALNKSLALNETANGRNIIKHLKGLRFKSKPFFWVFFFSSFHHFSVFCQKITRFFVRKSRVLLLGNHAFFYRKSRVFCQEITHFFCQEITRFFVRKSRVFLLGNHAFLLLGNHAFFCQEIGGFLVYFHSRLTRSNENRDNSHVATYGKWPIEHNITKQCFLNVIFINIIKGIFGYDVAFDENADVGFNLTLFDQHYVNNSKESCKKKFNPNKPCKGKILSFSINVYCLQ